jgi:hypothetical protein
MTTHDDIDARILRMLESCAQKIDREPSLLIRIADNASRIANPRIRREWLSLVKMPWPELRIRLLETSERGKQMRQNAPFYGILKEDERLGFFPPTVPRLDPDEVLRRTR